MGFQQHMIAVLIALTLWIYPQIGLAKPLSPAEQTVCKSVRHCTDIVSRHGPESYDYAVLGQEFVKLGDKGRIALLKMMTAEATGNNTNKAIRAQRLLVTPGFRFTPDEQRLIAGYWPKGDPQSLIPIMLRLYSPIMRQAALSTVSHPETAIQNLSLALLKAGESSIKARLSKDPRAAFQPTPAQFLPLIKAVSQKPSAELITFLSAYPIEKTRPTLIRSIRSHDPDVVTATYFALRQTNAVSAETIVLNHIEKTADPENIQALIGLLDTNLTAQQTRKLKTALEPKLPLVWNYLKRNPMADKLKFLDTLSRFERSAVIDNIYLEALNDPGNWRVSAIAANIIGQNGVKAALSTLSNFAKTHPIREVRLASLKALDGLNGRNTPTAQHLAQIETQFPNCRFPPDDIRDNAKRMPYFDGLVFEDGTPVSRGNLTSATPTAKGWLAGYSRKNRQMSKSADILHKGAIAYYDNAKGLPTVLTPLPVQFVSPKSVPPLGQTTTEFWAFVSDPKTPQSDGKLLSISEKNTSEKNAGEFTVRLQAELPAKAVQFKRNPDQSLLIQFSDTMNSPFAHAAHPPLRLLPNGSLLSACAPRNGTNVEAIR